MSGRSTHGIPQAGARPQRTETSMPWGQASIIPRECDGGVGGVECGVQSQAFRTCLATQPMALHKPAQDHREKRHPHHEGKPVYYPENVVEVLELWASSMVSGRSTDSNSQADVHEEGEGGMIRLVDRHMATEVQKDTVQLFSTRAEKQHLNMRDSRGVGGSGGVGGKKAAEVLEVDQFYIAGDADTESKQFKPEDI
ncbi:hypothetical protein DFH08DRAFT_810603 [Mycena albidolilacea]|uniref:Uncharacterized protein n=1 Tax=Mycena albidolilacea TaxID=1033008 RepID=A0AAD6ZYE2_9AGAR|nr:hypothetical protein DFH08DRAFT_810603 [Mycena albidolilacea]